MTTEQPVDLARQSLGRPLSQAEGALAEALEAIFRTGQHDFAKVAEELQSRAVIRPSGEAGPWTVDTLEAELRDINASLDAAYATGGVVRLGC